jgi:crotonobetainyl-CoA:carnitine CoA-transferase CaiB-like acyl-CoA transferase
VIQNQAVVEYDHPKVGRVRFPAYPVKMGNGAELVSTPAPDLGEHTQEVLKEILLCSEDRIRNLVQSGVVICK